MLRMVHIILKSLLACSLKLNHMSSDVQGGGSTFIGTQVMCATAQSQH
jgi:hypothetical protein